VSIANFSKEVDVGGETRAQKTPQTTEAILLEILNELRLLRNLLEEGINYLENEDAGLN